MKAAPPRKAVGLVLEGRGVLRSHMKLRFANGAAGETTSGSFAPSMKNSVALARVQGHAGGDCEVEIRGQWLPCRTLLPPFVRKGMEMVCVKSRAKRGISQGIPRFARNDT
jgi:aminomethyltransferase